MSRETLLARALDDVWTRQRGRVAIREGPRDLTFEELLRWSQAVCRALEPFVRAPGERVATVLPNSAEFVAAFAGIARLGAVVAPLHPGYREQELRYYLTDLAPAAIVAEPELAPAVAAVSSTLEPRPALLTISARGEPNVLEAGGGARRAIARAGGSPPLLQQYTSGSTGVPKRVVRTHANLLAELEVLRTAFEIDPEDRFVGLTPFSHVNGLVRTMLASMYVGARLYPLREFHRRRTLDLMTRERITFFGGVPSMFAILSQTPPRGGVDLSALRLVFSSSAPLSAVDRQRFQTVYGVMLRQLYGSTETGTISFNRQPTPGPGPQSVGPPLDGVRIAVVDGGGRLVAPGAEGEFVIQSPFAASEYLDNPRATQESFGAGGYASGDVGTVDPSGYLTIVGRKKLFINRGGFKVNPYEVEEAIRQHPKVSDVVVFGRPGPYAEEVVHAVIVTTAPCTPDEIVTHCRERIADYKIPARIEFRDGLPKSSTGKIIRYQV